MARILTLHLPDTEDPLGSMSPAELEERGLLEVALAREANALELLRDCHREVQALYRATAEREEALRRRLSLTKRQEVQRGPV